MLIIDVLLKTLIQEVHISVCFCEFFLLAYCRIYSMSDNFTLLTKLLHLRVVVQIYNLILM